MPGKRRKPSKRQATKQQEALPARDRCAAARQELSDAEKAVINDPEIQRQTREALSKYICLDEVRKHGANSYDNPMVLHKEGCRILRRGGPIIKHGDLLNKVGDTTSRDGACCHEQEVPYPWQPEYAKWATRNPRKARELEGRL